MNPRRSRWLLLAVGLLLLTLLLSRWAQDSPPPPQKREVEFPRMASQAGHERQRQRMTYTPLPPDGGSEPLPARDPLLEALPRGEGRTAVVIEVNALRHSPMGELLLDCLLAQPRQRKALEDFKQRTGVDPLADLDRIMLMDDGVVISGHFGGARLGELLGDQAPVPYGHKGQLYLPQASMYEPGAPGRHSEPQVGMWGDSMLVFAETPEALRTIVDRVEGRDSQPRPVVNTYGDVYGVVSVDRLVQTLPAEQRAVGERLKGLASTARLNMNVSSDFTMEASLNVANREQAVDVAKTLGAALSVARLKALDSGDTQLAEFLEYAGASARNEHLDLQLAVPLEVIMRELAWCREGADGGHP